MDVSYPDTWPTTPAKAIALQAEMRVQVDLEDALPPKVQFVAGVDVGFEAGGTITRAAVVVLAFPSLALVDSALVKRPTTFPYIPGLLSFREIPAILDALGQLTETPDLILCDGQGIAHPRRVGIASHLGLILNCPTIGVAKSRLIGTHDEVPPEKGSWVPLSDQGECIGAVLRSRTNTKPLYISPGHKISLATALDYVQRCTPKYRLPETTRLADRLASNRGPMPPHQSLQNQEDSGEQMRLL
ncbi:MAG: deoxyribonuclease V [Leptolyngbya sp. SIO1D8]|nr:deoxyribonuclease V [Leptolyngbya sp. SIO1D8]